MTIEEKMKKSGEWIHKGFEAFSKGSFDNGGDNLYVNASGVIEMIHRFDINNDGYVDIILPNSHGYIERGPTWIYKQSKGAGKDWPRIELPNDSGWMSRVVDVDKDGYPDLIVVNGENGVTSELNSYIYWGGPNGLTGERTELPTAGAYDVVVVDLTGNGLLDIIFPSAWVDHHNRGQPRLINVYLQVEPRQFVDASKRYGLLGIASTSIACEDLNGDGHPELVVSNYRKEYEYDTDSFVYWGTKDGFNTNSPLHLPTHYAMQVVLGDLNEDGWKEIVFTGGNRIYIYWNDKGTFNPDSVTILETEGSNSTAFCVGTVPVEIADVNGDDRNELLIATLKGIEIRTLDDLRKVKTLLRMEYCFWVEAIDLDGDGRLDIVASRYQNGLTYESDSAIFWNSPDGFSSNRMTWLPTTGAVGCTAGDLDGDGRPEIIFNNTMQGWSQFNPNLPVYIYLGSKECEYSAERRLELPTGGATNTYILADLDQDGYPDLVIVNPEGLRIFPGGPNGPKPDKFVNLPHRGQFFGYVLVADFNRDGWLDLLAVAYTYDDKPKTMANSSVIFYGSSKGFSPERSTVVPTYCSGNAHIADVNNDGWLDIIYGDSRGYLAIYLGGPDGYSQQRMWKIPLKGTDVAIVIAINNADLNKDGWLDMIVSVMGHYCRQQSGFFILYGGPDGFSPDRIEFHPTKASSVLISVADLNNDGNLDLLVPAYSTQFSRELPAYIFWGNGKTFDFDNPFVIQCDASCAFMAIDITGNGYRDVLAVCHRNDLGHQVDSLLFWNGPEGLSLDRVTRLPGLGPHLVSSRDFGNAYTREPLERYISPPFDMRNQTPVRIHWEAEIPETTALKFQLRWAGSEKELERALWHGPNGEGTYYERSGEEVQRVPPAARWLQYRATFVSFRGCASVQLREVRVELRQVSRQTCKS